MPRVFQPPSPLSGPGSAFAGTALASKRGKSRRRKARSHSPPRSNDNASHKPIGQDLVDWYEENRSTSSTKDSKKKTKKAPPKTTQEKVALSVSAMKDTESLPPSMEESRRALAVDTRIIDTQTGRVVGRDVLAECQTLVESLQKRGVAPSLVASTHPRSLNSSSSSKSTRWRIQCSQLNSELSKLSLQSVQVPVVSNEEKKDGDENNHEAVHMPGELSAKASWQVFGEMVHKIVAKDAKLTPPTLEPGPLDITLLTNDVLVGCDTNQESHKSSVQAFWKLVEPLFHDGKVERIQIVLALTGTRIVSAMDNVDDSDNTGDEPMKDDTVDDASQVEQHESAVSKCVRAIQAQLAMLSEADYQQPRGLAGGSHVDVSLQVVDHSSVGYQLLARQWTREALLAQNCKGRLVLDLPETVDGTQCSVSLDLSYQIFPFAVHSTESKRLQMDLKLLSQQKLEIVKLLPLDSLDACLLFGVPMLVHAGLEDDLDQFRQMQVLVQSLFKLLADRECAMLLQTRRGDQDSLSGGQGLFDSPQQTFVLMAKELPSTMTGVAPNSGILFRYAHVEQFLSEVTPIQKGPILDEATERQYAEYVEEAFECLDCSPVNPLCPEDAALTPSSPSNRSDFVPAVPLELKQAPTLSSVDSPTGSASSLVWNDATGVGSLGPLPTQDIAEESLDLKKAPALATVDSPTGSASSLVWNDATGVGSLGPLPTQDAERDDDDDVMED